MTCPSPHCAGTLHTGTSTGFCTLCRLPVSACDQCGAWNRAFAVFCRQCGQAEVIWRRTDPVDPEALGNDPRRTTIPQQVVTQPQVASGYLWAMGEQGDLYRLNPYAGTGEQLEIHDRFWAQSQPHAFSLGHLQDSSGKIRQSAGGSAREACVVLATRDRVLVSGLFSRKRRHFEPLPGESFLVNARDMYQFVAALGESAYLLSRYSGQVSFCEFDLGTGETRRFSLAYGDAAMCGPVLLADGTASHLVVWSSTALWIYTGGKLTPLALPEKVELWTAPADTGLRLPPGRSPAIAGSGELFLPARQFGRPALLRLTRNPMGWSTTAIALVDEGTLSEATAGYPLLSAAGRLLACTGGAFRTLIQDAQIATRFPAWAHAGLALFFCQADYRGLKQWLKAYVDGAEIPVSWELPPGAEIHACEGFWTTGTALCSICVVSDRGLRTEFLSWCA